MHRPSGVLVPEAARDYVDRWLAHPVTTVVDPTARHPQVLRDLLGTAGTAGNLGADAHLAALAIEHGADLCSADRDFGRFKGLDWTNPLAGDARHDPRDCPHPTHTRHGPPSDGRP